MNRMNGDISNGACIDFIYCLYAIVHFKICETNKYYYYYYYFCMLKYIWAVLSGKVIALGVYQTWSDLRAVDTLQLAPVYIRAGRHVTWSVVFGAAVIVSHENTRTKCLQKIRRVRSFRKNFYLEVLMKRL